MGYEKQIKILFILPSKPLYKFVFFACEWKAMAGNSLSFNKVKL